MSNNSVRVPAYCHHKAKDLAYVRLNGEMIYLGKYGSPESREAYDRVISEWIQAGRTFVRAADKSGISVNELLLAYRRYAEQTYVDAEGKPTNEVARVNLAFRPLVELYGLLPAVEFGPRVLVAIQQKMVDSELCRRTINQRIGVIKRAVRWAVKQELVPPGLYHGLQAVDGLRQGRSKARESRIVRPVPDHIIAAVLVHLPPSLQAMVTLHGLTGARSGELCIMRGIDIEMTPGQPWLYRPQKHKTERYGHQRVIALGPEAQVVLQPFLHVNLEEFIFSPVIAHAERAAAKRQNRLSKVQPSQLNRRKSDPERAPGNRWTSTSYRRTLMYATASAIKEGALPAGTRWHPHQIRHATATRIRRLYGLDAVRAVLGHRTVVQSAEYAELDVELATSTAAKVG